MDYTDIRYDVSDRIATITIDREERLNAFRGRTIEELLAGKSPVQNSAGEAIGIAAATVS